MRAAPQVSTISSCHCYTAVVLLCSSSNYLANLPSESSLEINIIKILYKCYLLMVAPWVVTGFKASYLQSIVLFSNGMRGAS